MIPNNMLPAPWNSDYFIAGGYAAHPALASDIDVWVTVPVYNSLGGVREDILAHLQAEGFDFEELSDRRADRDIIVDNYETVFQTLKVAVVKGTHVGKFLKPYHVLVTNGGVKEVLNSFDISTHAVAMVPELGLIHGDNWTPLEAEPVIVKDTPTTPARLEKILARYAHLRATVEA